MAVNWVRTKGMTNLLNQFNARWPKRDKASDGTVGDFAHTQEDSGHNPDDTSEHNAEWDGDSDSTPEVRAIDVDNDLHEAGTDFQEVMDHLRKLPGLSSVIRYMIYNRKIYRASNGFTPETYTGSSAHTEHGHFSGAYSQASDNNDSFDFQFEKVGVMPLSGTADKTFIKDAVRELFLDDKDELAGELSARPWQYKGGGLHGAPSSLEALAGTYANVKLGMTDEAARDATESAMVQQLLVLVQGIAQSNGAMTPEQIAMLQDAMVNAAEEAGNVAVERVEEKLDQLRSHLGDNVVAPN